VISLYMLCLVLLSIGLYCLLVKKNLIKKIVGLGIAEYAINLFFILIGYQKKWLGSDNGKRQGNS